MSIQVNETIDQPVVAPTPPGGLRVNPELADNADDLPEGVYRADGDIPPHRVELFRTGLTSADLQIFTIPRAINPRHSMAMLRDLRKTGSQETAMANFMYAVLGDAVMDALADQELSDEEFAAVMKAVRKHATGAMKAALGNF